MRRSGNGVKVSLNLTPWTNSAILPKTVNLGQIIASSMESNGRHSHPTRCEGGSGLNTLRQSRWMCSGCREPGRAYLQRLFSSGLLFLFFNIFGSVPPFIGAMIEPAPTTEYTTNIEDASSQCEHWLLQRRRGNGATDARACASRKKCRGYKEQNQTLNQSTRMAHPWLFKPP